MSWYHFTKETAGAYVLERGLFNKAARILLSAWFPCPACGRACGWQSGKASDNDVGTARQLYTGVNAVSNPYQWVVVAPMWLAYTEDYIQRKSYTLVNECLGCGAVLSI